MLRQGLLALLFCFLSVAFAQTPGVTVAEVVITLQNVNSSAWVVTDIQGAVGVAKLGTHNTPITLTVGERYRFVNLGTLKIHPLAIRGKGGESLLNQRPQERAFETDPAVGFRADGEGVSFTLTPALAEQVSSYYCTAHPAPLMEAPLNAL